MLGLRGALVFMEFPSVVVTNEGVSVVLTRSGPASLVLVDSLLWLILFLMTLLLVIVFIIWAAVNWARALRHFTIELRCVLTIVTMFLIAMTALALAILLTVLTMQFWSPFFTNIIISRLLSISIVVPNRRRSFIVVFFDSPHRTLLLVRFVLSKLVPWTLFIHLLISSLILGLRAFTTACPTHERLMGKFLT